MTKYELELESYLNGSGTASWETDWNNENTHISVVKKATTTVLVDYIRLLTDHINPLDADTYRINFDFEVNDESVWAEDCIFDTSHKSLNKYLALKYLEFIEFTMKSLITKL